MAPRLFAVCIGIDFYPDARGSGANFLSGCVGDCDSFVSYLKEVLEVPDTQITRLTSTQDGKFYRAKEDKTDKLATYENISKALLKLSKECKKDDQVLITYSGHGNRVWSIVPQWLGKSREGQKLAMDETLAPMDAFQPGGRELRDFELSYLLGKIVETGCRLTVVLDSCHSGGAFRAPEPIQQEVFHAMGLRARFTIFKNLSQQLTPEDEAALEEEKQKYLLERPLGRVGDAPGVSLDELQEHWNKMQDRIENVPKHQWLVKPFGYEIWTGCLQHELSWEINGGGRLTSALVDSLRNSRNPTSLGLLYRNVYDVVYGTRESVLYNNYWQVIHREAMLQTPILLGDVDRGFLTEYVAPKQVVGIPIHAVPFSVGSNAKFTRFNASEQKGGLPTLILRAGSAHGVQLGSEYAVYVWDDNLNTPPSESQVRVVITHVGTVASVVRVVGSPDLSLFKQVSEDQHTRQSNRMDEYYNRSPPEYWLRYTKTPQDITYPWPSGCQAVLVAGPSANVKRVRLVAEGGTTFPSPWDGAKNTYVRTEVPLLVVSEDSTAAGEDFQVRYNNGQYAVHEGSSGALLAQADSVENALRNIVHISQYRTWLGLVGTTTDPENIDLFTVEQTGRASVPGENNTEKIKIKFDVSVEYIETYNQMHVNIALFHFSPTFGVRQIYPQEGQFEAIDAGSGKDISFQREIPRGGAGSDEVKAVVYQCSTGFKIWELPELGREGGDGQPVRPRMELSVVDPAPRNLAEMDPVPGTSGDDSAAVNDGERKGYEKYWLLQVPIQSQQG